MNNQRRFAPAYGHFEQEGGVGFTGICIFLLVIFLPFQRLDVVIGPIGISLVDIVCLPLVLVYGIRIVTWKIYKTKLFLLIAIWLLATFISGGIARNKMVSLVTFGSYVFNSLILIASFSELVKCPRMLRLIAKYYVDVALFVAMFGGLQLIGLVPRLLNVPFSEQLIGEKDPLRMGSFLTNANMLAAYLSVAIFFSWVMYKQSSGRYRVKYFCAIILLMIAEFFTFSRAGYLGLAVGAMMLFMGRSHRMRERRVFKKMLGVFVVFILLFVFFNGYRALYRSNGWTLLPQSDTSELDSSNKKRMTFWKMAVKMFESNPVFGVGPGHFRIQFYNYLPSESQFLEPYNAHSTYLQILAETGLLGLSSFLALFGFIVLTALRAKGDDLLLRLKIDGALAGLLSLLIIGLTHNMIKTEIWFIAGIVLAYARQYQAGYASQVELPATVK